MASDAEAGCAARRRSLSAITVTSSSRLMPGSRIVRTSPVARAIVSPWRSVLSSAERHRAQQVVAVAAAELLVDHAGSRQPELDDGNELVLVALGVDDRDRQAVAEAPRARGGP